MTAPRASSSDPNTWLVYHRPNPQAILRLFCFPYAGGGASIFNTWFKYMPAQVEICSIQLPGHENRFREVPYKNLARLIDALTSALLPALNEKPFAFFGHSMGARIAFELVRQLRRQAGPQPVHLFVSGARAPQLPDLEAPIHQLEHDEFINALRRLNGTPSAVLEHTELMELFLPCLRADFELHQTYIYQSEQPVSMPLTVFGGLDDVDVNLDQLKAWREQTVNQYAMHMLAGDHFFLHRSREQLLQIVSKELMPIWQ